MPTKNEPPKPEDPWKRFERAVDAAVKSGPKSKAAKKKPPSNTKKKRVEAREQKIGWSRGPSFARAGQE